MKCWWIFLLLIPVAVDARPTPETLYEDAYRALRGAMQADFYSRMDKAWKRYAEARTLFGRLRESYPEWNAATIGRRLQECETGMENNMPRLLRSVHLLGTRLEMVHAKLERYERSRKLLLKRLEWKAQLLEEEIEPRMRDFADQTKVRKVLGKEPDEDISEEDVEFAELVEETGLDPEELRELDEFDIEERDRDDDGLRDVEEIDYGTDPEEPDTDDDGLTDYEEVSDYDTEPTNPDTDGDELTDGEEVHEYGTDPLNKDTDGDGDEDGFEVEEDFDPLEPKPFDDDQEDDDE